MNCNSLSRISARRSHFMSWIHPQKPSTIPLGKSSREQGPWCRWPGGHLSKRGRVGPSRAAILTSCPCPTRWRMGSPGTTSSTPNSCTAYMVVGCLINTLALRLCLGTPKINTFSGEATPGKTEISFQQWHHEVQYMKDHYPESVVWESIVRSLKGAVADMARYMGPTANVSDILQKLMVIFWDSCIVWCIDAKFL